VVILWSRGQCVNIVQHVRAKLVYSCSCNSCRSRHSRSNNGFIRVNMNACETIFNFFIIGLLSVYACIPVRSRYLIAFTSHSEYFFRSRIHVVVPSFLLCRQTGPRLTFVSHIIIINGQLE